MPDFWKSAGLHLLRRGAEGWLEVTPEFLCAYMTRPELHPIETSCAHEVRLHEDLVSDPYLAVDAERLNQLEDSDAIDNYRAVLALRDLLVAADTIEGAYLRLAHGRVPGVPPVFMDQMTHVLLRSILDAVRDPMQLRAAELFFREQTVSTEGGRVMLADEEIVSMHANADREGGLHQLLAQTGTPMKSIELDVLGADNKDLYWSRSDRFDTVIDFRFEQPAPDAFARVIEAWLAHLLRIEAKVQPVSRIEDADWRWHIGLDAEATRILNDLYEGKQTAADDMDRFVGLFRLRLIDDRGVLDRARGKPIYLGLAATPSNRVKMKPQNLLVNLPLAAPS